MISLPKTANTDVGCYGGGYWPLVVGPQTRLSFMFPFIRIKVCVVAKPDFHVFKKLLREVASVKLTFKPRPNFFPVYWLPYLCTKFGKSLVCFPLFMLFHMPGQGFFCSLQS